MFIYLVFFGMLNKFKTPELSLIKFTFLSSVLNLVLYGYLFINFIIDNTDKSFDGIKILFMSILLHILLLFVFLIIISFISQKLVKIVLFVIFVVNSIAFYFCLSYKIILDRTMIANIFNTDFGEAVSLYHSQILLYLLFLGILPAVLLMYIKVTQVAIKLRLKAIALSITTLTLIFVINFKSILWFDKNLRDFAHLSMPFSYIIGSVQHVRKIVPQKPRQNLPDAKITQKNTIVVLIIGESARRNNFSLYGYEKNTNPYLSHENIVVMPNTKSFATSTLESVKCILSNSCSETNIQYEILPDYLQRQGIDVLWRTNNGWHRDDMKIHKKQNTRELYGLCDNKKIFNREHDETLLCKLKEDLMEFKNKNLLVVLHQMGSHGPKYTDRYPSRFEVFKPVCNSVLLSECTTDELINAYDNTIVYTDYFIKSTIDIIKSLDYNPNSAVIYISDHGESLGEYNVYLHGLPYSVAPHFQKEIPFLVWMSDSFIKERGIKSTNFTKKPSYSHDNIFHSVIGAFGIKNTAYRSDLDIFSVK